MSSTDTTTDTGGTPEVNPGEMRLEVVVLPVSDVDRAKEFYVTTLGFRLDADFPGPDDFRIVQVTPPGSGCSVSFGSNITNAVPGSYQDLMLVVRDVEATRADLVAVETHGRRGLSRLVLGSVADKLVRGGTVPCRVFNLGCGPAWEVQRFLEASDLCNQTRFTLLDFNEETLQHARGVLEEIKQKHRRSTSLEFVKKSVVQLLRARSRAGAFCAPICQPIVTTFDFSPPPKVGRAARIVSAT